MMIDNNLERGCFSETFQDAEWIGKILQIKITAEFPGGNTIIRNVL